MRKTWMVVVITVLLPGALVAQQQSTDGPYVLHEYFTEIESTGGTAEPTAGAPNETFGPGQPPALSLEQRPGEPIYSKDGPLLDDPIAEPYGPLAPYSGANTLDDRTDRVGSLTYFANFDPSVIPYKRVVVQNHAVRKPNGDYALEVKTGERALVTTNGQEPADAETFWGTFLLRLEPNRLHPIASVAPGQTILQIYSEPDVALDVERDDADNYFVRSRRGGLVRVNMQVAVPSSYFGGEFADVEWAEFPQAVPQMEPQLQRHARKLAQELGFNRSARPSAVLTEMVRYFRNFDARPFPEKLQAGDRLEMIAENGIGVCRHRSLAFVFLAQSLGIPTRYVYNEAHAFVEVYWPQNGWRRIDLGGAADELTASANQGRATHDPGRDELPEPERYLEEQNRMARNGWTDPNAQRRGGDESGDGPANADGPEPNNARADAEGGTNGQPRDVAGTNGRTTAGGISAEEAGLNDGSGEELFTEELPPGTPPPTDDRVKARLSITEATAVVRRGSKIRLRARLVGTAGEPLANRSIDAYIGPVGSVEPTSALRIGTVQTDGRGEVRTSLEIPKEHAIGRWSLFLVFGGDQEYRMTVAE